jgi:hypothetical protein
MNEAGPAPGDQPVLMITPPDCWFSPTAVQGEGDAQEIARGL